MTTANEPGNFASEVAPVELSLHFTTFKNAAAAEKRESVWAWQRLVDSLIAAKTYPSKEACPFIKLARFGDIPTVDNCLRHNANVLAICGVEGDYDGMQMSVADGATLIADAGVEALIYTSPRHTPEKPRWRVLCPLSQELPPGRRAALVGRLNGILGGILARESFTLSQSYYYGRIEGVVYEVQQVRGGRFIDQCDGLTEVMAHQVPGAVMPAHEDDATREEHIIEGHEGQVYPALRDLAAAHAARGMAEADSIAHLFGLLDRCNWRARNPPIWQERRNDVVGFVQSARQFRPYANDETFDLPAGEAPTMPDAIVTMTMIDDTAWPETGRRARRRARRPDDDEGADDELPPPITSAQARLPRDWIEVEQHPPPFVVEGLFPESEAGSLVGPGGSCKSTLKLYESVHIILGRDLYGRHVLKPGPVLCVSKEDRGALIDYRLKQITRAMGLSADDLRRVHRGFLRLDLRGDAFMLQQIHHEIRQPVCSRHDVDRLLAAFEGEGIVSAWFDTASRFTTGENNQEAAAAVASLTMIADAWKCATEVLHHVSQGIARNSTVDMYASRGGTAFVDNGRFARQIMRHAASATPGVVSYTPPPGFDPEAHTVLRMHVVKLSGAPHDMHAPIWIERREDWRFVFAEGERGEVASRDDRRDEARTEQAASDDAAVLAFVVAALERDPPLRLTQNDLIQTRQRIVGGMSEPRVRAAVSRLKHDDRLIVVGVAEPVPRGPRTFLAPFGWQERIT